METFSRLYF